MATDFLTAAEKSQMRADLLDLVQDPQVGGTIRYDSFVSRGAFSPTTGQVSETYAGTWVDMMRFDLMEPELASSGGQFQFGDSRYMIPVAQVGIIKKDDRIFDDVTRYVVRSSTDAAYIFHAVIVRNLAGES